MNTTLSFFFCEFYDFCPFFFTRLFIITNTIVPSLPVTCDKYCFPVCIGFSILIMAFFLLNIFTESAAVIRSPIISPSVSCSTKHASFQSLWGLRTYSAPTRPLCTFWVGPSTSPASYNSLKLSVVNNKAKKKGKE